MGTYEAVLASATPEAVVDAAQRFTVGDVPDQSRKFAPSIAEFMQEVRRQEEYLEIRARPRLPAPVYRPGPLAPFQIAQNRARSEHAGREVLFENIDFDKWKRLSKDRMVPVGAVWVASLGTVYGPPAKQKSQAA